MSMTANKQLAFLSMKHLTLLRARHFEKHNFIKPKLTLCLIKATEWNWVNVIHKRREKGINASSGCKLANMI